MVFALAVTVPVAVAAAVLARPAPPLEPCCARAAADSAPPLTVAWQADVDDGALHVVVRLGRTQPSDPASSIEVEAHSGTGEPELLAYWTPHERSGEALPRDSVLLGPLALPGTRRFRLPRPAASDAGDIVVYALAQDRIAASVALPATTLAGRGDAS
jgi:hypothetical protein